MEEYVDKLALWQAHRKAAEDAANNDREVCASEKVITILESQIAEERERLANRRAEYDTRISEIDDEIKHVSAQIIDEWTGEEKTMSFDAGTLKFRISKSLEIVDGGRMLGHIIKNTSTDEAVSKYLKGFLLTPTKAYVDVHGLGEGIAKINSKTTVKLEHKSG